MICQWYYAYEQHHVHTPLKLLQETVEYFKKNASIPLLCIPHLSPSPTLYQHQLLYAIEWWTSIGWRCSQTTSLATWLLGMRLVLCLPTPISRFTALLMQYSFISHSPLPLPVYWTKISPTDSEAGRGRWWLPLTSKWDVTGEGSVIIKGSLPGPPTPSFFVWSNTLHIL